ncbi:MAG: PAS domain S-box protein [Dehalococcoidales bacterium]|nr:MAG: PAS domain S-box protein [Dehalococcoidales bacterium]
MSRKRLVNERVATPRQTTECESSEKKAQLGEEKLGKGVEDYFDLLENASDIIQSVSPDGRFLYVNRTWRETFGYTDEELTRLSLFDIIHPDSRAHCMAVFERVISGECIRGIEATLVTKDGKKISVEANVNCRFEDGKPTATRGVFRNVTERKQAEIALRKKEDRYRNLVENLGDIVYSVDTNGIATYLSPIVESVLGYSPSEIIGRSFADFIHQDDILRSLEHFQKSLSGQATIGEYRLLNKAGEIRWVRSSNRPIFEGNRVIGATGVLSDITERRQTEERLKKSEEALRLREQFFHSLMENASDGFIVLNADGIISYASTSYLSVLGYSSAERIGTNMFEKVHPDDTPLISRIFTDVLSEAGRSARVEVRARHKDGSWRFIEATGRNLLRDPAVKGITVALRDITARRQADEALRNSEEKYRTLVENSHDSIVILNTEGEVQFANKTSEELTGYTLNEGIGMNITEFIPPEYLEEVLMKLAEAKSGKPIPYFETAIRRKDGTVVPIETGGQAIIEDGEAVGIQIITRDITERKQAQEKHQAIIKTALDGFWLSNLKGELLEVNDSYCAMIGYTREELLKMSVSDIEAIENPEMIAHRIKKITEQGSDRFETQHRRKDGEIINVEVSVNHHVVGEGQQFVFIRNITERKWAEEELRQSFYKLLRTSEGTIQAMAATIESRDPYTAGHQRRVAELADAIARDIGLQEDQVEGIRMAAIVHDIGKIYIPAEILSKPIQLTDVEFNLIKMHPQAGHDILKNIDFPWSVADMVLGHHERLDGSGYPFGIHDDDISVEARILGVADVVEAISSYRPYRPAKGIDNALGEISKQSGILYDPAVVDACLRLFTKKEFRFSDETTSRTSLGTRNQHIITPAAS